LGTGQGRFDMEQWGSIIAALINTVIVLGIVQLLKMYVPKLKEGVPWLIPIFAGAIGPAAAVGQTYLGSLLGVAIDLNPIVAIFTGASATAMNQVYKQAAKVPATVVAVLLFALCSMLSAGGLTGCATLGGGTTTPTQDEQARIIVGGFQTVLPTLKTAGDAYVMAQPQYQVQWQAIAIPAFVQFNTLLGNLEAQGAAGKAITGTVVLTQLQGQMAGILTLYYQAGMIPSGSGGTKLTPEQTALLVVTALNSGSILLNELTGLFSGNIPTWGAILAQNQAFQVQLGK
jgi:hypothetical protein